MTLHLFNPEHDIALASGLENFTAPHAGRQLRHDLGYLPALWAADGDAVMVDDADQATRSWRRLATRLGQSPYSLVSLSADGHSPLSRHLNFVPWSQRKAVADITAIEPWGWNSALRATLLRRGYDERLLPTLPSLDTIRQLSHRRLSAELLPQLQTAGTVGLSYECRSEAEVASLLGRHRHLVLKAPWSSSGRGLRFATSALWQDVTSPEASNLRGFLRNVIATQGSVMAEPYYNKVKDFGMEFHSDGHGTVTYLGLSLFHTRNGAYAGNILATEATKRLMIGRYLPLPLLDATRDAICQLLGTRLDGHYSGPFGVDMMIVGTTLQQVSSATAPTPTSPTPFSLHPCVEINLRRTMGHVALSLQPAADDATGVMRITFTDRTYHLNISRL